MSENRKRSGVWLNFSPLVEGKARCDICRSEYSYKGGSTANLLRHLKNKHPGIELSSAKRSSIMEISIASSSATPPANISTSNVSTNVNTTSCPSTSTASSSIPTENRNPRQAAFQTQARINDYLRRPTSISHQKKLDEGLVYMVCRDYQPFSIVENEGFQYFCHLMNPGYPLPSRSTLTKTILPRMYEQVREDLRQKINIVNSVCLTTDGWTSPTNESYIAVTAHFIGDDNIMYSHLLECRAYSNRHTAENLKDELCRVVTEWNLTKKVVAVVSDNAANIKAAVSLTGWTHLPCFAHTLNLIVQEGLKEIKCVQEKVKAIVEFFNRSTQANEKFKTQQKLIGNTNNVLKLKQDVITRWNSTLAMLVRFNQLKDSIISTLALVNVQLLTLTPDDWKVIAEACEILQPFDEVTVEISAEKTVSASKIILLARGLMRVTSDSAQDTSLSSATSKMAAIILNSLVRRYNNIESQQICAQATLLDPRFKKTGFTDSRAAEEAVKSLTNLAARMKGSSKNINIDTLNVNASNEISIEKSKSVWKGFDERATYIVDSQSPNSEAIIEVKQYLNEPLLHREGNPLQWWKDRAAIYPRLVQVMKQRLCVVATSVPCERIFSKTGQTITDRRSRLISSNVEKMAFLNVNLPHMIFKKH